MLHKIHNIMPNIRGVWRLSSIEGFKLQKYSPNKLYPAYLGGKMVFGYGVGVKWNPKEE
jgi:hypothetical protein